MNNEPRYSVYDVEAIDASSGDKSPTKAGQNNRTVIGIYVGTAGDLDVILEGGGEATFHNLPIGFHPLEIKTVKQASTASQLVIVYARFLE